MTRVRRLVFASFALCLVSLSNSALAELFISEYIEGSSNNKAIEIYNPGPLAVDLGADGYELRYYFNGNGAPGLTIALAGSVAAGDVFVVAQSSATAAILAEADQTNGSGWYNGDDAVVLASNGTVIDAIGQVGFDPGSEWGSGDASTANNTLRRKADVCAGDTNPDNVFDPSVEWDGFAQDTFDGLGAHSSNCLGPLDPVINEFSANTTGTDIEYVEIFGSPDTDYSAYSVLEIEGDSTGAGVVDEVIAVGATDANGLYLASLAANTLENGTMTLLLVENFVGSLGNDLDTDNDGAFDTMPWDAIVDAVAVYDGGSTDITYGVPELGPNYDGLSSFTPGGASRYPDGFDTDAATDWVRNDFDLAGIPGYPGTPEEGEAYNTPGDPNALVGMSEVVINEFSASTTGTDVEYVEIFGYPDTDYSAYSVLEIEGDSSSSIGAVDEIIALGTTDANGLYLASLPANALENGTLTLLLVKDFSGNLGDDLDTNDDGVLDAAPWTVLADAVAVNDGGAGDLTHGLPELGPNYDGLSSFAPGGASRYPDGFDTDAASDWVRNDFDLAGLPGIPGSPENGEAYNTPGAPNLTVSGGLPPFGCGQAATLISAVQGNGTASPLAGATVDVEAVVTAVFQGSGTLGGLFLQEEDADADADPATSEGLFAYTTKAAAVGDHVRVRGTVLEFNGLSELSPVSDLAVCATGVPLPTPASVSLPVASLDALEAVENMSVQLANGLVVSDVFTLWRYGEFAVSSKRLFQPTAVAAPGAPALAVAAANALDRLIVDDGRTSQNLPVIHTGQDDVNPFAADNPIRSGQAVDGLAGVLHYAFGAYRLQPTAPFVIDESANPRTTAPAPTGGTLRVAGLNVLNFFTTLGSRGASSAAELVRQTDKLVAALAAMDADIVGLVELENDAGGALAALTDALNAVTGAGAYAYVDTGVIGLDGIKAGLIYKPARVTPEGDFALLTSAVDARFNDDYNRPSLAQTFRANDNLAPLTVVVSHLKSKGSDCNALGDPDTGDGQGNCNLTRTAAAAALADWIAADPTGAGTDNVIALGDLNAYAQEDPITTLSAAGLVDLVAQFEGATAYSFSFDAQAGSLDYALGTAALLPQVTGASTWHINADEAVALDYNEEFGKPAAYYAPDAYRAADHDPLIVGLDLDPPAEISVPTTDPNVAAEVRVSGGGDSCGFSAIAFVDPATLSPQPPSNLAFPYGVLSFTAERCTVGATVTIEVEVPEIAEYLAWYKLISGLWQVYPASWNGGAYVFTVTDGGPFDADGVPDGRISDPSGPALASTTRATFLVSKAFSDDNPAAVDVNLSCNTGLPLTQSFSLADGETVEFIVTGFLPGAMNCTVTESGVTGYSATYTAGVSPIGVVGTVTGGSASCTFEGVANGRMTCAIENTLEPVRVVVGKEWDDPNLPDGVGPDVRVRLFCGVSDTLVGQAWINRDTPGEFSLLPDWQGMSCRVEEDPVETYEPDLSDCDGLHVEPGSGDACTVVNARFYEGIPALGPYGLALLALLMLGVGFIGARRFV